MKKKKQRREIATRNVRIYNTTLEILGPLADETGKTYPRLIDEKFNPEKYLPKQ